MIPHRQVGKLTLASNRLAAFMAFLALWSVLVAAPAAAVVTIDAMPGRFAAATTAFTDFESEGRSDSSNFGLTAPEVSGAAGMIVDRGLVENTAIDHVRIDNFIGGVPEPAAWASLIAGMGIVGAAMRRRRMGQQEVSA